MNNKLICTIAILTLFLAACSDGNQVASVKSFIGGTDSIKFDFVEGSPPSEVFDQGNFPFDVTLNLENKGEFDVVKDKINVTLKGFFPPDFDNPGTTKSPDENLDRSFIDSDGKTVPGTVTFLTFPGFNFKGSLPANNEFTVRAELCYLYGFTGQSDVCILDDLTEKKDDVCVVNEKKSAETSSSPVQIENFEESVAGTDKIAFNFEVVHRGTGAISKRASGCDDEQINKDKVFLQIESGIPGLTCSGIAEGNATSGFTTLVGGKRLIRCTQDTTSQEAQGKDFEKKITIKGDFDYKAHKQRNLLVKHTSS